MEEFTLDVIDVKRDGSCFFSAIALAMNQSIDLWQDYEFLRNIMEYYWDKYIEEHGLLEEVTPHLIRFICSENIDSDIFETYCIEAKDRINEKEKHVKQFKTLDEMKEGFLNGGAWGDHSSIRAFFKAFGTRCSLVIIDEDFNGVVFFQKEWTKRKDMYICIQRVVNHYQTVQLICNEEKMNMCLTRKEILRFKRFVNYAIPGSIKNDY